MLSVPRWAIYVFAVVVFVLTLSQFREGSSVRRYEWQRSFGASSQQVYKLPPGEDTGRFDWGAREERYPVTQFQQLPRPTLKELPRIQYDFSGREQTERSKEIQRQRLAQVKNALKRTWDAYRLKAWGHDELGPLSGKNKMTFGGWGATLVDTLDTLWIMDLKEEFSEAVDAAVEIDFSTSPMRTINVFETTIRFLGGFISAYDLSGDERLLHKALELADVLYAAFDTPNRLPVLHWKIQAAATGQEQIASKTTVMAELGSLSLEFTRLSQLTDDPKWYDAIERIMAIFAGQQKITALPGMWPTTVDAEDANFFLGKYFSLGAWADSTYEYLPKMYALLGGSEDYEDMYRAAMDTAIQYTIYRPMIKENATVFVPGAVKIEKKEVVLEPELQHLSCYAGGMFALGGRLMGNASHVDVGKKLTNGCIWAYKTSLLGIMPETSTLLPCANPYHCTWNETIWRNTIWNNTAPQTEQQPDRMKKPNTTVDDLIKAQRLPPGFTSITNRHYFLRPEAIESVFILYRITGDKVLREHAWNMFRSVHAFSRTPFAHAAIVDVTNGTAPKEDSMESFWSAETLKYFYLTFADEDVISLDEYVLNTEAHPFKLGAAFNKRKTWGWWT